MGMAHFRIIPHRLYKPVKLMLHWEINAVYSETHKTHVNTLSRQKVEHVNLKPGGT